MEDYLLLSDELRFKYCKQTPDIIKKILNDTRNPSGYAIKEAEELIKRLRSEGYSKDPVILRNKAISILKREM